MAIIVVNWRMCKVYGRARRLVSTTPGDRIAQLLVTPVARVAWRVVEDFAASVRGVGGFGSTGVV